MTRPIVIQDEQTRRAVDPGLTVGDLCMEAIQCMVNQNNETQRFTILKDGCIYYFDVTCVGIKPPYQMQQPESGTGDTFWFGQKAN